MSLVQLAMMLLCVLLTSVAQVVLKIGTSKARLAATVVDPDNVGGTLAMLVSPMVILGLVLYIAATIVYLRVLSVLDLSQVYPFVALSYVFTMAAGILWLGESLHVSRLAGAALILGGVALISYR
ncbi:MAG: EamA family transporter [Propionivibrio sp.]|uniref:EamA family transporter n=1 Tax=Propionivibrio sp. TaxID=2212460 RepID=UPI001A46E5B3|nr:EamA family transporter [Propionivibrio sp.]MBL8414925.1 EamA family transporter [Propionivibrio sp.]